MRSFNKKNPIKGIERETQDWQMKRCIRKSFNKKNPIKGIERSYIWFAMNEAIEVVSIRKIP